MNRTNIGTLGAVALETLINYWNACTDNDLKSRIKSALLSERAAEVQGAIGELRRLPHKHDIIFFQFMRTTSRILTPPNELAKLHDNHNQGMIDNAHAEIAFYFGRRFQEGFFETLPMPEFGYELLSPAEPGSVEKTLAAAKVIVEHLPKDLEFTQPPEQPEHAAVKK
jgi:hypothetical protein